MYTISFTRKKQFYGCAVKFFVVIGYDVEAFWGLAANIKAAELRNDQYHVNMFKQQLANIQMIPIANNQTLYFNLQESQFGTPVFVTNAKFADTKTYPLTCSNCIYVNQPTDLFFEAEMTWKTPVFHLSARPTNPYGTYPQGR